VLLFTPLTLETTSMWTTGAMLLPMELAMILAIGAQVKYAQTRRPYHLVTLAGSTVLGLFFFDKALLIVPLVFLVTACLLVTGGPLRSIWRTIRGFWPSWLVLTAVALGYLALYYSLAGSTLRTPRSASEIFGFARQMVGFTLIPNLLGGPRTWVDIGDAAPLVTSEEVPRWLAWAAFLAIVVITTRLRSVAGRAWVLLACYVALVVALLSASRLGSTFSVLAGYATRYVSDVTVVAALCLGVAVMGLANASASAPAHPPRRPLNLPSALRDPAAIAVGLVVLLVAVTAIGIRTASSTARFSDLWAVKRGRDYLATAQADLAKAPPGTVFIERTVPAWVVHPLFFPYAEQAHFFNQVQPRPVFVTEAENPSVFDDSGHIRPATVDGLSLQPSPDPGCGYQMSHGGTTRLPLAGPVYQWNWTIRIGYLSSGNSDAVIWLGGASHPFQVKYGLNQIFIVLDGAGTDLQMQVMDPDVTVCTKDVVVGNAVPQH
jgi:hypothetical protein